LSQTDDILSSEVGPKRKRESRRFSFILYGAAYRPKVFLLTVYKQLIVLLAMFVSGAAVFSYFEHLSPIVSLLASVSTITTIGLYVPNGGNFYTLNHSEAVLLIVLIVVSVGVGASIVQSTVGSAVNGAMAKGEVDKKLIARLKDHAIVFGYDHVGRYVADKLGELGVDYVVVTRDPQAYDSLIKSNVFSVHENPTRPVDTLKAAGVEKAGTVIVCHSSDSDNMIIVLTARKPRPDIRIISIVNDVNLVATAKDAGADVVIPASVTVGHLLALSAVMKNLVGVVFSEKIGTKEIAEFTVFKTSRLIGRGMPEVARLAMVIGVVRNDAVVKEIFDPAFRLQVDDTVLVLGDPSNLHTLEEEAKAT
jgi:voltage-gated potassium channel